MDQFVVEGVVDFGTQAADRDFHHIGVAVEVHVPHQRNDLGARQHFAALAHQQVQQGELLGGQVDTLAAAVSTVPTWVQLQVGDFQGIRLQGLVVTPQQATDTRQQFRKLEGLEHVVVGAQIEAFDPVREPAVGGEHHDPRAGVGAQALQHGPAIELGQVDVENDQVVGLLAGQVQAVGAAVGTIDDVAVFAQTLLQVIGGAKLVLDNQ
ncbi:hypothetical protein D9M71_448030 [compost metagenome]